MPQLARRPLTALLIFAIPLLAVACGGSSGSASDDGVALNTSGVVHIDTPSGGSGSPVIIPKGLSVGTTALPDSSSAIPGATFALAPTQGHLNLVFFGYTNCPDVCPGTMQTANRAFAHLGSKLNDVSISMVSVDPKRDTAARMRTWVAELVTDGHGHGLRTDDAATLAALEKRMAIVAKPYEQKNFEYIEHTGGLFAVAPGGSVVAEWPYGVAPETLASDITKLLDGRTL